MSRPTGNPNWATDPTYAADAGPDAGLANKVAASAGKRAQGVRRGEPALAPEDNYWRNLVGAFAANLQDIQVQNWNAFPYDDSLSNMGFLWFDEFHARIFDFYPLGVTAMSSQVGEIPADWETCSGVTGGFPLYWGASNPAGVTVIGGNNSGVDSLYRSITGTAFSSEDLPVGFTYSAAGCWDPANNLWIAGESGRVATSPDGITWTARSISGGAGAIPFGACATDGHGTSVFIGSSTPAARSTDGINWSTVTIPASSYTAIAWNEDRGLFMAVGTTGRVAVSADGVTWVARSVAPYGLKSLACDGALWVCSLTDTTPAGIAYSTDDGVSWQKICFNSSTDDTGDTLFAGNMAHFRNAFWTTLFGTTQGSVLYRSLRVGSETAGQLG